MDLYYIGYKTILLKSVFDTYGKQLNPIRCSPTSYHTTGLRYNGPY